MRIFLRGGVCVVPCGQYGVMQYMLTSLWLTSSSFAVWRGAVSLGLHKTDQVLWEWEKGKHELVTHINPLLFLYELNSRRKQIPLQYHFWAHPSSILYDNLVWCHWKLNKSFLTLASSWKTNSKLIHILLYNNESRLVSF